MSKDQKPKLDKQTSAILEMLTGGSTGGSFDLEALLALEQQKELSPVLDAIARVESKLDIVISLLSQNKQSGL